MRIDIGSCLAVVSLLVNQSSVVADSGRIEIGQKDLQDPPYRIEVSGSYILTSPLVVTQAGANAIWVMADHVELDLNGFTIFGPGNTSVSAIYQSAGNRHLKVRNGNIENWAGGTGAAMGVNAAGAQNTLEDLLACRSARGFYSGRDSMVRRCIAFSNASAVEAYGIRVGDGSQVQQCIVRKSRSTGHNSHGILTGAGCVVSDCVVSELSGAAGFSIYGINAGAASRLIRCVSYACSNATTVYGLAVGEGGSIRECVSTYHAASSSAQGFSGGNFAIVQDSLAYGNDVGIKVANDALIQGCMAAEADADGFQFTSRCRLENNYAYSNAWGGFSTAGYQNQLWENDAIGNYIGFYALMNHSNFLARNTGLLNTTTNYSIAAGNSLGTLRTNPGRDFTVEEPWANFSINP
ncbi:MAG: hypothetical protein A2X46_18785 [Lentisphaerae bacterium GWF2_57_35]|nr:MAG: hypothetical protein A2X46_18785 [Lentisphaerae bacterium GWF2_57_35]